MKSCDNCYWKYNLGFAGEYCTKTERKPNTNLCDNHDYKCSECDSNAEIKDNKEYYCTDCFMKSLGVETYTQTHYIYDGEYMGSDDDIMEVLECITTNYCDEGIEMLD